MAEATVSDTRDTCEQLSAKLLHLQAQTVLISGEGLESFQSMNDTLQANYLWGVQAGINECVELANKITSEVSRQAKA
jgi:hypothetical protein